MTIRIAAAFAAAVLTLAMPTVSLAQDGGAPSASVTWDDLDVTTSDGAAQLDRRINDAARRACRGMRATGSNMNQTGFCRGQIRDSVLARMDAPTREAYNRARNGGRASARADRA